VNDPGTVGSLTQKWQYPTYTPYMTQGFVSRMRILKTKNFELGPGEQMTKTFRIAAQHHSIYHVNANDVEWWKKGSYAVLWTWTGQVADDGASDSKITLAKTQFQYVYNETIDYDFLPSSAPQYIIEASNSEQGNTNQFQTTAPTSVYIAAEGVIETLASTHAAPIDQIDNQEGT